MLVSASWPRFLVCFLALFVLPLSSRAQDAPAANAPLQMALSSPFALTAKPLSLVARRGRWFPIAVTLSNTGDPVTGQVRLKLYSGGGFDVAPNEFYCPVDMPTNARKVIWLYGRMERPNVVGIDVSFSGRGFKALTQRIPIQEPEEGQRVVLTISDTDSGLSDTLKSLRGSGLSLTGAANPTGFNPSGAQGPLRPLETAHQGVPDRWVGLESADMVVLSDFPHSALNPPQIEALRGFVRGGGNLLVLGGANAARLTTSPLADLWPAQITGSGTASAGEVAGLVRRFVENPKNGGDRLGGSPVVVARGGLKPVAQLRDGTSTSPLFSLLDEGAGRTIMLSFDPSQPPFNGWSGQTSLWRDVFSTSVRNNRLDHVDGDFVPSNFSSPNPYAYGGYNSGYNETYQATTTTGLLLQAMAKAPQLRMPPVSQIAWFLALYVFVLVPLNYAVLRFIDRRELAWVTIPVIVTAFSIFAYTSALSIRGRAILTRQVDVVQGSIGSKAARTDSLLWLFSPKRTTYDVSSDAPGAAVADYANEPGTKQGAFSILQPADADGFKVEGANVWMWTDRAFTSQSLVDMKKGINLSGDRVQNGTPLELNGAVWVQDSGVRALGTIKSGASAAIPGNASETVTDVDVVGAIIRASRLDTIYDEATRSNGIPDAALRAALGAGFGRQNGGALFIAWATQPAAPLSIGAIGANSKNMTLVVLRVAPSLLAGTRVASREAIVNRVAYEPNQAPNNSRAVGGGLTYYDCLLPQGQEWTLLARGKGLRPIAQTYAPAPGVPVPPGAPPTVPLPAPPVNGRVARGNLPIWVHLEAWNASQNRWLPLQGKMSQDESPNGGWKFVAPISSAWPRQPERLLRVRVRTDNGSARISSLRITKNGS